MQILKEDILNVTGYDQLCSGLEAGCEAGVHAVNDLFNEADTMDLFKWTLQMLLILSTGRSYYITPKFYAQKSRVIWKIFIGGKEIRYNTRRCSCHGDVCSRTNASTHDN